jgi:hypothetical protein
MARERIITFRLDEADYQKILFCVEAPIKISGFCRGAIRLETKRRLKLKKPKQEQ